MKLTITIDMDNEAFDKGTGGELARILRKYANHIADDGHYKQKLFDVNGNQVGTAVLTD
jgi:hypothetical protein